MKQAVITVEVGSKKLVINGELPEGCEDRYLNSLVAAIKQVLLSEKQNQQAVEENKPRKTGGCGCGE